ncbi:NAD(P)-dependent oxidoreductase [Phytoactinopolyspora halophila]|uniref:NAD(P)-dependent oxidoreductase n=1 Tax=Phytoactinopolyspora halophila TaxID=1981511 RepID=UPI001B8AD981|nr:NAD(P)-dependent oxidoreductase [Phytoactinopolyspora halophila]
MQAEQSVQANQAKRPVVLVTSRSFGSGHADPEALLAGAGLDVVRGDPAHGLDALTDPLARASGWIAGSAPVRAEHLRQAPRLRIVARYGTGVDAVDLAAAQARGIVVTNTPGANTEAVADYTLALITSSTRNVVEADRAVREGSPCRFVGRELGSLTVGVIGMGNIGRAVARRMAGLGAAVLGADPAVPADIFDRYDVRPCPLDELVRSCDVISLHCPGGGPPVLDRALLANVRAGAVIVNTARADVVDESALAELLHAGKLGAVASDVTSDENGPLRSAPRAVLTPHIAGHTAEAVDRMGMTAAQDVRRVLVGNEPPSHPVPRRRGVSADDAGQG